jgi:hypothetical protein
MYGAGRLSSAPARIVKVWPATSRLTSLTHNSPPQSDSVADELLLGYSTPDVESRPQHLPQTSRILRPESPGSTVALRQVFSGHAVKGNTIKRERASPGSRLGGTVSSCLLVHACHVQAQMLDEVN